MPDSVVTEHGAAPSLGGTVQGAFPLLSKYLWRGFRSATNKSLPPQRLAPYNVLVHVTRCVTLRPSIQNKRRSERQGGGGGVRRPGCSPVATLSAEQPSLVQRRVHIARLPLPVVRIDLPRPGQKEPQLAFREHLEQAEGHQPPQALRQGVGLRPPPSERSALQR